MKRLKQRSGFSLVECVVAMAVLAIMSLLLTMILSAAINTKNKNAAIEKDIDSQVENIAKDNSTVREEHNSSIEFKQEGSVIDTIPKNSEHGIVANKLPFSGSEVSLGILDYDFSAYDNFKNGAETFHCSSCDKTFTEDELDEDGKCPLCHGEISGKAVDQKLYGAVDIRKNGAGKQPVTLTESVVSDAVAKTKTITLNVNFIVDSVYKSDGGESAGESALKIVLPAGLSALTTADITNSISVPIARNIVRIVPKTANVVEVNIKFTLTEKEYNDVYKNVSFYFTGAGEGSSVTAYMNG